MKVIEDGKLKSDVAEFCVKYKYAYKRIAYTTVKCNMNRKMQIGIFQKTSV